LIAGHDPCGRLWVGSTQQAMKTLWTAAFGDAVQPGTKGFVRAGTWKQPARQRAIVETSAADENRQIPTCMDLCNDASRIPRVLRRGIHLGRIDDIDEMMRNSLTLGCWNLVRADIETPIDGR
jgi:hypothetical protein